MISLRKARIDDHWRTAFKRPSVPELHEIKISNGKLFENFSLTFHNGISAIIGKNGIGKSTLIRTLYNILQTEDSNRTKFDSTFLTKCDIELSGVINGASFKYVFSNEKNFSDMNTTGTPCTGFMYDPCYLIPLLQKSFQSMDNVEELLAGYDETQFSEEQLVILNYITGNEYSKIFLTNIEDDIIEGVSPLPFFKIERQGMNYDTRFMGLGELSIFYFVWLLEYIKGQEGTVVLLVEEPESFIPPTTQERISNQLARCASKTGTKIILSTHSEHILRRIPRSNISVMRCTSTGVISKIAEDDIEPLKTLGLSAPKIGIIFFEDEVAGILIKALLQSAERYVPESFYYHNATSESHITSALKALPRILDKFRTVGVYDGDAKGLIENVYSDKNYCFLPDVVAPEKILIPFLQSKCAGDLSKLLNRSEKQIENALENVRGLDHHDYFEELGNNLYYERPMLLKLTCEAWVKDEMNKGTVEEFLNALQTALEITPGS